MEFQKLDYRVNAWDLQLAKHIQQLKVKHPHKPVILIGDLNVAHQPLDFFKLDKWRVMPGLSPEERDSFNTLFLDKCGMVDTYRQQHPYSRTYTCFNAMLGEKGRTQNMGYRLDYALISQPTSSSTVTIDAAWAVGGGLGATGSSATSVARSVIKPTFQQVGFEAFIEHTVRSLRVCFVLKS